MEGRGPGASRQSWGATPLGAGESGSPIAVVDRGSRDRGELRAHHRLDQPPRRL